MAHESNTKLGKDSQLDPRNVTDSDGHFRRKASTFRDWVSSKPGARFQPEAGRYSLYINRGCPWAHRANAVRRLKGLEDIIELVEMSFEMGSDGWIYDGSHGTADKDPITGTTKHKDLYTLSDPEYEGRYTVPVLFDKQSKTIVNNESAEIIRMLYSEFDQLIPEARREVSKPGGGLLPIELKGRIDEMNEWIYDGINNGVYKVGFAQSQEAYNENVIKLFQCLDKLERTLESSEGPFLFGSHLTEADIRLYPTIVRFDPAYHTTFRCNLKMIRYDYPYIQKWLLHMYYDESEETRGALAKTTYFDAIKQGYAKAAKIKVVPMGPLPHIAPKP